MTNTGIEFPNMSQKNIIDKDALSSYQAKTHGPPVYPFTIFCCCSRRINTTTNRHIFISEPQFNRTPFPNKNTLHKYSIFSFLPVVLFNQFCFFGNLFYLLLSISQFIPSLKVGFLFSYIAPLTFVLIISLGKEIIDDFKRFKQESLLNSEEFNKISINEESTTSIIKSKDVKVGDILELSKNERVPADMVLLKTYTISDDNNIFIRTDQLDGETDWKLRKPPAATQSNELHQLRKASICASPPSREIYKFEGTISYFDINNNEIKEPLSLENTLWSSCVIASEKVIGIVIYTGEETREKMNSSNIRTKIGKFDIEVNKYNKYLFVLMTLLAIIMTLLHDFDIQASYKKIFLMFLRFIILFCGIIPISLRVNLDISKAYFSLCISKDSNIKTTIVRNSTIPEELGRIAYLFTDKTGTLTQNEMVFKYLSTPNEDFSVETFKNLRYILLEDSNLGQQSQKNRRNRSQIIKDIINAMAICNNVTPTKTESIHLNLKKSILSQRDSININEIDYQSSSPDEVALVKFASLNGITLVKRNAQMIVIQIDRNKIEFQILAIFPFSSERKRMGIIVKNVLSNQIIFYLKGADSVMKKKISNVYNKVIEEKCDYFGAMGLRTLVLSQKYLSENEFTQWKAEYDNARTSMGNRAVLTERVIEKLEVEMDYLCVTGVEDLLQNDLNTTIENLRQGGIKIWMLTGDKMETAKCISISTGIKAKGESLFPISCNMIDDMTEEQKREYISNRLNEYNNIKEQNPNVLIIDGDSLQICLDTLENKFFTSCLLAPSVVCCRCSPTQKNLIVKTIKKYTDKITCAIGDGGNDVAMIQSADIGIGIVGKEGLQASQAGDFSVLEFKYLNTLIFWWGRLSYKNSSTMAQFVFYRGLMISFVQLIFSVMFYYSDISIYNGMLLLGYSTVYTFFPAFVFLVDMDIEREKAFQYPQLYKELLKGKEMAIKVGMIWFWKSLFQSTVIMIGCVYLFDDRLFLKIVTVSFTAMIASELLNVYTQVNNFSLLMAVMLIGSLVTYLASLILFKNILDVFFIFDLITMGKIGLIILIGWFPFFIIGKVKTGYFPERYEKIR